jgi:hypothetical protein
MDHPNVAAEPATVLRYHGKGDGGKYSTADGNRFDTVNSLSNLVGYRVLERECMILPHVPGASGSQVLIMLQSVYEPTERVRIGRRDYERLRRLFETSGAEDTDITGLVDSIGKYLGNLPKNVQ